MLMFSVKQPFYRPTGGIQPRGARRLTGGRRFLAVALEDSVQMLVTLPPTREPPAEDSFVPKRILNLFRAIDRFLSFCARPR